MDKKNLKLKNILRNLKRVVVAYSGGLDSTFLLKTAIDTLGRSNVIAVTARSETYPISEYKEAKKIARKLCAKHIMINTNELKLKSFKINPVNRCYYCKRELFKRLDDIRKKYGMNYVLDGTNFDDLKDIRHGMRAAKELKVRSPLLEAKITKDGIRKFSRRLKLPTWNKPSFACLASRIPFGDKIKEKDLKRISDAEEFLKRSGLRQVRVRLHNNIARLEVSKSDFRKVLELRHMIINRLKKIGFVYIALDLAGYRTGSMHESGRNK